MQEGTTIHLRITLLFIRSSLVVNAHLNSPQIFRNFTVLTPQCCKASLETYVYISVLLIQGEGFI